uniref:Restriction alleviation protein n=1 Tax=Siphoviridae sp. ctYcY12 TaxID=2825550 RepID=A0A8S5TTY7_9CAUD|nr:MAG TPA: restriction alleviation protein [Siphoviridae sp. ctYcY12]
MYMVKCNNPDCPVPERGYPTGRNLDDVKNEWNRRAGNETD